MKRPMIPYGMQYGMVGTTAQAPYITSEPENEPGSSLNSEYTCVFFNVVRINAQHPTGLSFNWQASA